MYTLDNSPLSDVSVANIFSQSVAYLLDLLTLSFAEQKFLIFFFFNEDLESDVYVLID